VAQQTAADVETETRQKPAGHHGTDDSEHDIADEAKAAARNDLTGQPAGNSTDNEPNDEAFQSHVSSLRFKVTQDAWFRSLIHLRLPAAFSPHVRHDATLLEFVAGRNTLGVQVLTTGTPGGKPIS